MDDTKRIEGIRALTSDTKHKKVFRYLSTRVLSSRSTDAYSMKVDVHAHFIKELFLELEKLNLGQVSTNGRRIEWFYEPISIGMVAMGSINELKSFSDKSDKKVDSSSDITDLPLESIIKELNRRGFRVSLELLK